MKKILFVCTGNTCRSPMAELVFNSLAREKCIDARAQSAGLCTIEGLLIHDNSAAVLEEIGIESDFFRSTDISDLELDDFDKIYGMTEDHVLTLINMGADKEKVGMLGVENGGVADPYGSSVAVYRACRDEIIDSLKEIINEI